MTFFYGFLLGFPLGAVTHFLFILRRISLSRPKSAQWYVDKLKAAKEAEERR